MPCVGEDDTTANEYNAGKAVKEEALQKSYQRKKKVPVNIPPTGECKYMNAILVNSSPSTR